MTRLIRATTAAALGRCFLALISMLAWQWNLRAEPRVYKGLVVTDVRVETTLLHNASLKITFEGDTNDILAVPIPSTECGGTPFYYITKGEVHMEIEFQGRTRTARLQDNQVFVAVDPCNGGIGFGSFLGPNGVEPAYPLALTLGTAEYAAITNGSPLAGALSTTGSAWSCIGYPPLPINTLPGAPGGNCIPPDSYPLKSDIGDIFVYQPYYESENGQIASNHSGSTNRGAFLVRPNIPSTSESAPESGVVYTLRTVADGSIGDHVFRQALVTFRMTSDTKSVTSEPSQVDASKAVYENRVGNVTVTVDDGDEVITAKFKPGEVYVRYDTGAGIAGFGSRISPTYPIALGCSDSAYPSDSNYVADCLQGDAWNFINAGDGFYVFRPGILAQLSDPVNPSAGVAALPQSLSQNTLLTGTAHTCAGVYTFGSSDQSADAYFPGDLGVCGGPAPRGLHTSKGELFLQDLEGGTLSLGGAAPPGESGSGGGWDLANSGFLHVEVYKDDD
ncbi:MAG TPA: hypothetical protein VE263_04090 [Candidatus Angelobacter sp.]|nr:hypothetical protein [Candidatus Angelobacter sp.]